MAFVPSVPSSLVWLFSLCLLVVGAPLLATGCPVRSARAAADLLIPPRDEVMLGLQISAEIEGELTMHSNADVQAYVASLGAQVLARVEDRPGEIEFTFQVVNDLNQVNAFAIPGGWIYVYSGLMQVMESEAELASVLAHEIAHVTRRHIAQRLVAMYGLDAIAHLALGEEPGLLGTIVSTIVQQGAMLRYTRDMEREADDFGLHYLVSAGYDPRGFIDFLERLTGRPSPPTFLLTHPSPEERIERIERQIRDLETVPEVRNVERFMAIRQLL